MKWNLVPLGTVCTVSSSKRIFAKEYRTEGIPFYRGKEVIEKHKGNPVSTELFISKERYEEIRCKYDVPQIGDILLTSVGTLGVSWSVDETEFYFKDGNLTWLRAKDGLLNKFLYLWLNSDDAKHQIDMMCIGSTQKALTIETINKFVIPLPSMQEQESICAVIYPIIERIKNNRQINDNLYRLLMLSFKHDYWDAVENHPEWTTTTLGEATSRFGTGLNPRKNFVLGHGSNYYVTIKNMRNNRIYLDDHCDKVDDDAIVKIQKRSDLQVGDLLFSGIGTIGRVYLIDKPATNWNTSESVFNLRPGSSISSEFLYLLLLHSDMQEYAINLASGSVQKGIRMADLKRYSFALPTTSDMGKLTSLWAPLIRQIKNNEDVSDRLAEFRDTLIPKLMNGEIDASTIDI